MANKGKSRHMTSLSAPKYFAIHRKESKYVKKPNPGRHTLDRCVSLLLAMKKTGVAGSTSEAAKILSSGNVMVNNKVVRETKYPVGLNDILEIKGSGKSFRISIDQYAKMSFEEIGKPNYESLLYRVIGKYKAAKGQVMVRLHDGSITRAKEGVRVNDSVILDSKRAIKEIIHMAPGAECFVVSGVHVGTSGRIKAIKEGTEKTEASAVITPKSGEEFETIIKNVMIVG